MKKKELEKIVSAFVRSNHITGQWDLFYSEWKENKSLKHLFPETTKLIFDKPIKVHYEQRSNDVFETLQNGLNDILKDKNTPQCGEIEAHTNQIAYVDKEEKIEPNVISTNELRDEKHYDYTNINRMINCLGSNNISIGDMRQINETLKIIQSQMKSRGAGKSIEFWQEIQDDHNKELLEAERKAWKAARSYGEFKTFEDYEKSDKILWNDRDLKSETKTAN